MDGDHSIQERLYQRERGSQVSSRENFIKEAKLKAASYCAYQDRTQQQVRDKLYDLGLHRDEVEEVLTELITENFVNEERFAKAYARGKFYHNHWGRLKIKQELQARGLSSYCLKVALQEIEETDYLNQVESLITKKSAQLRDKQDWIRKNKIARYLIGKGYEADLVWSVINEIETL